ncbi:MAG: DUF5317 family protein [Bacillota bacterium]|nr:DUF5317 domain-containing protein [Bacillota bacterium]MDW7729998.1 DUF5317 family protein [Bacillota bacterium]
MLWEAILLGVIIGWLIKGRVKNLNNIELPGWPLIITAIVLQTIILADFHFFQGYLEPYSPYLYMLSFLLLLVFIIMQKLQTGIILIGIGILLNLVVITANQGKMPVDTSRLPDNVAAELAAGTMSPFHTVSDEKTNLSLLGDWIPVWYKDNRLLSIGDILLALGVIIYIPDNMQKKYMPKH